MFDPFEDDVTPPGRSLVTAVVSGVYNSLTRVRNVVGITVVGFFLLAFYGYYVDRTLDEARSENLESSIWVIGQIEPRFLSFQLALDKYGQDPSDPDLKSDLMLHSEILINRIDIVDNLLRNTKFKLDDSTGDMWRSIVRMSGRIERLIDQDDSAPEGYDEIDETALVSAIQSSLPATHRLIRDFNVKTMQQAVSDNHAELRQLRQLTQQFAFISIILIGTLLVSIVFLFRNAKELMRRGQQIRSARDSAIKASEAKSRFFAVISHEMRTPISGVIAAIDALKATTQTSDQQYKLADVADRSARTALEQINNVLDLAWLEKGDHPNTFVSFNVRDAIEDMVEQVRPMSVRQGNEIELELPDRSASFVRGPHRIFLRPLQNLLGNAIKYNTNGLITVRAALHNGRLRVEIEDEGAGIPENQLEKIFEPFERLSDGKTRGETGTGLGLVIARRAVESMNGKIGVSSSLGCGALFWFEVPIEQVHVEDKQRHPRPALEAEINRTCMPPRLKTHRILLVEDDEASRTISSEMLRFIGQDVTEATNGEEALKLARANRYDLIFMDVSMPRLNGEDATRMIRKRSKCEDVPIIGVTAFGSADEISAFQTCGMTKVMAKPLTHKLIIDVFEEFLNCTVRHDTAQSEMPEGVSQESLNQAMTSLCQEVQKIIANLPNCPTKECREQMSAEVHRTKGLASILGRTAIVEILGELMDILKSSPGRLVDDHIERLKKELDLLPC